MNYDLVITGTIGGWDCLPTGYIRFLLSQKKDKDVHVAFCSFGGYVMDGLIMNQLFRDHGKVHAHAIGMNASISTIAMLGCQTIDIVKGSFYLIHNTSTVISTYSQKNKEELDEYIKNVTKQRNDLATFDDVLAQMYADKTGKPKKVCAEQMAKGNWMTAEQALEFGLVDSIRDDKEDEKKSENFKNLFVNNFDFKEAGIPPLPSQVSYNGIADNYGKALTSLQKAVKNLNNLLHKTRENNNNNNMNKHFKNVAAIVGKELPTNDAGQYILTDEQMELIDNHIKVIENQNLENGEAIDAAVPAIQKLKKELEDLKKSSKDKDEQIKNLQNTAGDNTVEDPQNDGKTFSPEQLWDCIKNV